MFHLVREFGKFAIRNMCVWFNDYSANLDHERKKKQGRRDYVGGVTCTLIDF